MLLCLIHMNEISPITKKLQYLSNGQYLLKLYTHMSKGHYFWVQNQRNNKLRKICQFLESVLAMGKFLKNKKHTSFTIQHVNAGQRYIIMGSFIKIFLFQLPVCQLLVSGVAWFVEASMFFRKVSSHGKHSRFFGSWKFQFLGTID